MAHDLLYILAQAQNGHPQGLEVYMKNGLLRFYLLFMFVSVGLFSCENHEINQDTTQDTSKSLDAIERKPESRHPVEPNDAPADSQKGKKSKRKYIARSSNWC